MHGLLSPEIIMIMKVLIKLHMLLKKNMYWQLVETHLNKDTLILNIYIPYSSGIGIDLVNLDLERLWNHYGGCSQTIIMLMIKRTLNSWWVKRLWLHLFWSKEIKLNNQLILMYTSQEINKSYGMNQIMEVRCT